MGLSLQVRDGVGQVLVCTERVGIYVGVRGGGVLLWLRRWLGLGALVVLPVVSLALCCGVASTQVYPGPSLEDATILQMGEVNKRLELFSLKQEVPSRRDGLAKVYSPLEPPPDAWGNPFLYVPTGPDSWELISLGADGLPGGEWDLYWSEQ